ncbi:MAG: hypothetical protein LBU12_05985 [Deltaproteobacteria bacterium]|jgi:hypothetical protein|nr:hypothetical protein [Deltaproteobacteria bacterium]
MQITTLQWWPEKIFYGHCAILNSKLARYYYDYIWHTFIIRLNGLPQAADAELFGVCTNLKVNGHFEYWTVAAISPEVAAFKNLSTLRLEASAYGNLHDSTGLALPFIYGHGDHIWDTPPPSALNWHLPFIEKYRPDWREWRTIEMWAPLLAAGEEEALTANE